MPSSQPCRTVKLKISKGQRYLTVVVDNDTGRLVWAAKGHGKAVLLGGGQDSSSARG